MIVNSVGSVLIWSENWRQLANWYKNILELPVESELSLPDDTGVNFKINDFYFWVGMHDQIRGKNKDKYRIMIGFDVDSVAKTYEILTERGVEFILKPSPSPTKTFFVATALDPEDNIIQFYSDNK